MPNGSDPLTRAVRLLLGDPAAEIVKRQAGTLGDGFADAVTGGDGLQLHSGVARTDGGDRDFQLVTKTCAVHPEGTPVGSWLYWKREALAYDSGLLDTISVGLRAPRCFGVEFIDESTAVIFMEALANTETEWSMEAYALAGRALGEFNGNGLNGRGLAHESWMAPGRAFSWVEESRQTLDSLAELRNDPVLSRWLSGASFNRTIELWRHVDRLRDALGELPRGFCHHDAFRRNLMILDVHGGEREVVAIDWAFAGPGVVGEELAAMIGASLQFMEVEYQAAKSLETSVFEGYVEGLRLSGWDGAQTDARLGLAACTSMTFALGALGVWGKLLRDPEFEGIVRTVVGAGRDEFIDRLAIIQSYFLDLGEEAVSLIGSGG